jgi:hypothetical protein
MNPPPDPLDPLLDRWGQIPAPPPRLAAEVWRRIAHTEEESTKPLPWWAPLEAWFARPPFAALFIVSCALLGLFLAEVRLSRLENERSAQIARSYLHLIDPLLAIRDNSPRK